MRVYIYLGLVVLWGLASLWVGSYLMHIAEKWLFIPILLTATIIAAVGMFAFGFLADISTKGVEG